MPKTARTRGEEVFEEYLASLGRKFTYEPNIGRRQPDYLVHRAGGDVLCASMLASIDPLLLARSDPP
jgi:hypothetical protein